MRGVKKIFLFGTLLLFSILFFVYIETGYAAQDIANMNTSVSVNPVFSMEISPASLDFSSVDQGKTSGQRELGLSCSSNKNNPWIVSMNVTSEFTSGTFAISNDNFHWEGSSSGGTWPAGTTGVMGITQLTFYECGLDEYITSAPVEVHLSFSVDVPAYQAAGTYTTSIVVKMKDTVTLQELETIVNVTLEVNSEFTLSVSPSSLNFGIVDPGRATGPENLNVTCSTNNNVPWNVRINVIAPLTSGAYTILNRNFTYNWYSGGTETGYGRMRITPIIFYQASLDEYITDPPVEILLTLEVAVPPTQITGTYTTTLILTMVGE